MSSWMLLTGHSVAARCRGELRRGDTSSAVLVAAKGRQVAAAPLPRSSTL